MSAEVRDAVSCEGSAGEQGAAGDDAILAAYCASDVVRRGWLASGGAGPRLNKLHVSVTDNCNLRCVWCHAAQRGFSKDWMPASRFRAMLEQFDELDEISITSSGEVFTNPELLEIVQLARSRFPDVGIGLVTNGMFSNVPRALAVAALVDRLAFSVDAAATEAFSEIRRHGSLETVLENVRRVGECLSASGARTKLSFVFTASVANLRELPGVVELAGSLSGVDSVYVHPLILQTEEMLDAHRGKLLSNLEPEAVRSVVVEATRAATRVGVELHGAASLVVAEAEAVDPSQYVPFCRYPYERAPAVSVDGRVRPCCYMSVTDDVFAALDNRYSFGNAHHVPLQEIYSGEEFWRFRSDLIAGKTADICGTCSWARNDYLLAREAASDGDFGRGFRRAILRRDGLERLGQLEAIVGQRAVVGWGAGSLMRRSRSLLGVNLAYLVEGDSSRHGQTVGGLTIHGPSRIFEEGPERVCVAVLSSFYGEIAAKLERQGFKCGRDFV